jgi:hypothetical protein
MLLNLYTWTGTSDGPGILTNSMGVPLNSIFDQ